MQQRAMDLLHQAELIHRFLQQFWCNAQLRRHLEQVAAGLVADAFAAEGITAVTGDELDERYLTAAEAALSQSRPPE